MTTPQTASVQGSAWWTAKFSHDGSRGNNHPALLQEHPQAQIKSTRDTMTHELKDKIFNKPYAETHLDWEETCFIVALLQSPWIVFLFDCNIAAFPFSFNLFL